MLYHFLICLGWAVTNLPSVYSIPLGGAGPLIVADVVGAPTDDVSCPVRESNMPAPCLLMEINIVA